MIGTTLGHYRIVEQIGAGGMGAVYRAHDVRLDRDVAIKVLPEGVAQTRDRLDRFEREARAVAKLDHPNILAIHDFGTEEGVTYAVMELLEGETLRELIAKSSLTVGKSVEYARVIADGLAAAHDKDIVHRDLKPENVFRTRDGRIKILDFGLAKLKLPGADLTTETPTETLDTAPGRLFGTVAYMAPEQVQGQTADHRSDIFALGVVLYEMLTGTRPFGGSTTVETAAAILKEDPEPMSSAAPGVPPTLAGVVSKCLEKRPEDRFSSAHDLSLTLGAIDRGAPAQQIKAPSVISRRWPRILAVVIATIIALLAVLPPDALIEMLTGTDESPTIRSIALLPLENLTGDPEQAYFVDGLHEELTSKFAQISAFDKVIARTSVMAFRDFDTPIREIGRQLDVDGVLEGSVRQYGDTVRVTLQLIDVPTESHVWADSFESDLTDILELQSEVARAVAGAIDLSLTQNEKHLLDDTRRVNRDAYRYHLRGMHLSPWLASEENLERALENFETAIEIDPTYAEAYVGLSRTLLQLAHFYQGPSYLMPRAHAAAVTAVELNDRLPDAHGILATINLWWQWDWPGAEAEINRALELNPNDEDTLGRYAEFLATFGEDEKALRVMHRALELDPLHQMTLGRLGWICYRTRHFDEGIENSLSALDLYPNHPHLVFDLGANYFGAGKNTEAVAQFEHLVAFAPSSLSLSSLAYAYSQAGRTSDVADVLERLLEMSDKRYVPPSSLAFTYYLLGDDVQAAKYLENAFEGRDTQLVLWVTSPITDPYRFDPHFQDILRRMDLPGN